jgi:hypothetical protein
MSEQLKPKAGKEDVTEALIAHLRKRQAKGRAEYGRSLETFNGRDAGRDLLEELLDGAQYAMQLQLERAALEAELARWKAALGPMRLVGMQMANACFNLAQTERTLSPADRAALDRLRRRWDATLDVLHGLPVLPATPEQPSE